MITQKVNITPKRRQFSDFYTVRGARTPAHEQFHAFRIHQMNICTPSNVLVGVPEMVKFRVLLVGTGKCENIDVFNNM